MDRLEHRKTFSSFPLNHIDSEHGSEEATLREHLLFLAEIRLRDGAEMLRLGIGTRRPTLRKGQLVSVMQVSANGVFSSLPA